MRKKLRKIAALSLSSAIAAGVADPPVNAMAAEASPYVSGAEYTENIADKSSGGESSGSRYYISGTGTWSLWKSGESGDASLGSFSDGNRLPALEEGATYVLRCGDEEIQLVSSAGEISVLSGAAAVSGNIVCVGDEDVLINDLKPGSGISAMLRKTMTKTVSDKAATAADLERESAVTAGSLRAATPAQLPKKPALTAKIPPIRAAQQNQDMSVSINGNVVTVTLKGTFNKKYWDPDADCLQSSSLYIIGNMYGGNGHYSYERNGSDDKSFRRYSYLREGTAGRALASERLASFDNTGGSVTTIGETNVTIYRDSSGNVITAANDTSKYTSTTEKMFDSCTIDATDYGARNGEGTITIRITNPSKNFSGFTISERVDEIYNTEKDHWAVETDHYEVHDFTYTIGNVEDLDLRPYLTRSNILLDKAGGSGGGESIQVNFGQAMPTVSVPSRNGFTFLGYFDAASGGTQYYTANGTSAHNWDKSGDTTLYAHWKAVPYALSYSLGGGSAVNPSSYTVETPTFTLVNPARNGYAFDGWTGTGISGTSSAVTIAQGSTGDRAYTAHWKAIPYALSYDLGGGSAENPSSYTVETDTFALANPTRKGYTFDGWTGTGISGTSAAVTVAKGSIGARQYTAHWSPVTYTIGYDLRNGTQAGGNPETYTIESGDITLAAPTRAGFTFDGWSTEPDGAPEKEATIPQGSTGGRKFYAHWTRNTVPVTLQAVGGDKAAVPGATLRITEEEIDDNEEETSAVTVKGSETDGSAPINLPVGGRYKVEVASIPDGYLAGVNPTTVTVGVDGTVSTDENASYSAADSAVSVRLYKNAQFPNAGGGAERRVSGVLFAGLCAFAAELFANGKGKREGRRESCPRG